MALDLWPFNDSPKQKAQQSIEDIRRAIEESVKKDWRSTREIREDLGLDEVLDSFAGTFVANVVGPMVRAKRLVRKEELRDMPVGGARMVAIYHIPED